MIKAAAPIEHDTLDPGPLRTCGNQSTNTRRSTGVSTGFQFVAYGPVQCGRRCKRCPLRIVYDLRINMLRRPEDGQGEAVHQTPT